MAISLDDVMTWFAPHTSLVYHDVNVFSLSFIILFGTIILAFIFGILFLLGELFKFALNRLNLKGHIPMLIYNTFIYSIYVVWTFLGGILLNFFFVAPTYGSPCKCR